MTDNHQEPNGQGSQGEGAAAAYAQVALSMIARTAACPLDGRFPTCGMPCNGCTRLHDGRLIDGPTGGH